LINPRVFAGREREISGLRAALGGGSRLVLVAATPASTKRGS
jgi:hypothetical protein